MTFQHSYILTAVQQSQDGLLPAFSNQELICQSSNRIQAVETSHGAERGKDRLDSFFLEIRWSDPLSLSLSPSQVTRSSEGRRPSQRTSRRQGGKAWLNLFANIPQVLFPGFTFLEKISEFSSKPHKAKTQTSRNSGTKFDLDSSSSSRKKVKNLEGKTCRIHFLSSQYMSAHTEFQIENTNGILSCTVKLRCQFEKIIQRVIIAVIEGK